MVMTLEDEMRREAARLEREVKLLDAELEKLRGKTLQLLELYRKKEHDLGILKGGIEENYIAEQEREIMEKIMKGRSKLKI